MRQPKASILVVEDDPAILQGLLDVLVFHGYAVQGAPDGRQGLEAALEDRFDLVLLDVMLPGLDGFTVCHELRRARPGQAVVMLTAKGSEDDVVTGFKAGADDYVCKPFSLRELIVRVEAVLRRAGVNPGDEVFELQGVTFDGAALMATTPSGRVDLTRRELEIVAYLRRRPERIVSKQDLLRDVWRYGDADIETRTVDIHIMKLRKKLAELVGERPFILTVRGEGYRLAGGES